VGLFLFSSFFVGGSGRRIDTGLSCRTQRLVVAALISPTWITLRHHAAREAAPLNLKARIGVRPTGLAAQLDEFDR
jgi:hypothetical protein